MFKNMCIYMHVHTNICAYITNTELYRVKTCLLFPTTKKKNTPQKPKHPTPQDQRSQ